MVKANFYLNTPFPDLHQVDIEDAPEEWGLQDDTYNVKILRQATWFIQFEILGGEHDGETYTIVHEVQD